MRKPDGSAPQGMQRQDDMSGRQVFGRHPEALARMASLVGLEGPAPYMLLVERETPAPAALTAAPLPPQISNRHLGYAITWFGLAAALATVYAALVLRLLGQRRSRRF
jgi:surfeit locus 1 family protein